MTDKILPGCKCENCKRKKREQMLTALFIGIGRIWEIQAELLAREGEENGDKRATRDELIEGVKNTVAIIDDLPDKEEWTNG